jgi:hypothetical protein
MTRRVWESKAVAEKKRPKHTSQCLAPRDVTWSFRLYIPFPHFPSPPVARRIARLPTPRAPIHAHDTMDPAKLAKLQAAAAANRIGVCGLFGKRVRSDLGLSTFFFPLLQSFELEF